MAKLIPLFGGSWRWRRLLISFLCWFLFFPPIHLFAPFNKFLGFQWLSLYLPLIYLLDVVLFGFSSDLYFTSIWTNLRYKIFVKAVDLMMWHLLDLHLLLFWRTQTLLSVLLFRIQDLNWVLHCYLKQSHHASEKSWLTWWIRVLRCPIWEFLLLPYLFRNQLFLLIFLWDALTNFNKFQINSEISYL